MNAVLQNEKLLGVILSILCSDKSCKICNKHTIPMYVMVCRTFREVMAKLPVTRVVDFCSNHMLYKRCSCVAVNLLDTMREVQMAQMVKSVISKPKVISNTKWNAQKKTFLDNLNFIRRHGPTNMVLALHDLNDPSNPIRDIWYYLTEPKYLFEDLEEPIDDDNESFIRFIEMLESALKELNPRMVSHSIDGESE